MFAVRVHAAGGADALQYEQIADPAPDPGQALVRVEAAGVNFIDVYQRSGLYRVEYPFVPGQEGAGTVLDVASDVTVVAPRDIVAWAGPTGAYAQLATVNADRLVPVPAGITTKQAAAAMLQGMTAHYLTTATYPLRSGETCLVHAAAGGVGRLLCQIARMRGAHVIGTVGTPAKVAVAKEAGADDVMVYSAQDFETETRRLTGGAGVHVVYDSVGRGTFDASLRCLNRRGMMVLYGQSSGPVPAFDPQVLNQRGSLFLTRPSLGHHTVTREELLARAGDVLGWVADHRLRLHIGLELPLAQAAEAHRRLEARATTGKVLLIPEAA